MNTSSTTTNSVELPDPGYPMMTHMISHALFHDMPGNCSWGIDHPHPLVPEMKVVRMFVVDGGVHVYSAPESGICTRSFMPMRGLKITEEVMPLDVFVEELARTVSPGSPVISRMVSNSFSGKEESIVWIVGQAHPFSLSGMNLKLLRILIEDDVAAIYSVSSDGNSGMRHYIPVEEIRFAEEALTPDLFVKEMEAAENGDDDELEPRESEEAVEPGEPEQQQAEQPTVSVQASSAAP